MGTDSRCNLRAEVWKAKVLARTHAVFDRYVRWCFVDMIVRLEIMKNLDCWCRLWMGCEAQCSRQRSVELLFIVRIDVTRYTKNLRFTILIILKYLYYRLNAMGM